jgi:hypothetical protein
MLAYVFAAMPIFVVMVAVIVNNLIIYCHMRRVVRGNISTKRNQPEAASTDSGVSHSGPVDFAAEPDDPNTTPDHKASTGKAAPTMEKTDEQGSDAADDTAAENNDNTLSQLGAPEYAEESTSIISNVTKVQQEQRRDEQRNQHSQQRHNDRQNKRLQEVAFQAFLYVGGFLLTQLPVMILGIISTGKELTPADDADLFPFLMLRAILWPLQGFWNLLIFIRPAYIRET